MEKVMPQLRILDFIARKLAASRVYRQVIDELSHYNERELADIGLLASDVRRIASESARQLEQTAILEGRRRVAQVMSHAR
jgi:uncharacterized protein YjiS (DUF1127 family)